MANISRWDPMQDMLSLREAMNQLLEESFVAPNQTRSGRGFNLAMDLSETEDGYVVEAAVPGVKPEDIEITVENNVLTIKGETRQEKNEQQQHYHRVERSFGSFQRTIGLPTTVKADAIKATMENGVLRLEIPKAEEVKPRKITVNASKQIESSNNQQGNQSN